MTITVEQLEAKIETGPIAVAREVIGEALKSDAGTRGKVNESLVDVTREPGEQAHFNFDDPAIAEAFAASNPGFTLNSPKSVSVPNDIYKEGKERVLEAKEVGMALGSLALAEGSRLDDPNKLMHQGATLLVEQLAEEKGIQLPPGASVESYHGTGELAGMQMFHIKGASQQTKDVLDALGGGATVFTPEQIAERDYLKAEDANFLVPNKEVIAAVERAKASQLEAPAQETAPVIKEGGLTPVPDAKAAMLAEALAAGAACSAHITMAGEGTSVPKNISSVQQCR